MRCDDVTRELSAPTGEPNPAALAEHLAGCPRCASWAQRSARLDQIWEATRPGDPPAGAFDRVWANVAAALDRPPAPVAVPAAPSRRRRVVLATFTVAQAAAILAAFTLAWRESVQIASAVPVVPTRVDIAPGEHVWIDLDHRDSHLLDQARVEGADSVDPMFTMLNAMEGLAGTL